MTHEEIVYAALSECPQLSDVSIDINAAAQTDTYPFIVVTLISAYGEQAYSLGGESLNQTRWQVDVYSNVAGTAIQTGEAIKTCLYDTFGSVCLNKSNSFEKETRTHRTMLEFSIWL